MRGHVVFVLFLDFQGFVPGCFLCFFLVFVANMSMCPGFGCFFWRSTS